jgi:hypothetical protein
MKCGSGNYDGGYLDTGIYIDYEGQLLLCKLCFFQFAEFMGCIVPEIAELAKKRLNELAEQNGHLTSELADAKQRLAVYDDALRGVGIVVAGDSSHTGSDTFEAEQLVEGLNDLGEPPTSAGEPSVTEPTPGDDTGSLGSPELRDITDPGPKRLRKSSGPSL